MVTKFWLALKYNMFAALTLSLIWLIILAIVKYPKLNHYIYYLFIIAIPLVSVVTSLVCAIVFIVPSVLLLEKINLDKKIPVVIIGAIVGLIIWYLLTVEVSVLYVIVLYSVTCSFAFMIGYEKTKTSNLDFKG